MLRKKSKPRSPRKAPAKGRSRSADRPSWAGLMWLSLRERHGAGAKRCARMALAVAGVCTAVALGLLAMEHHVLARRQAGPSEFRLRLSARPEWMPRSLARALVARLTPADSGPRDPNLTRKVYHAAKADPWVRRVTRVVRRPSDDPNVAIVELQAEFRKPIACIQTPNGPRFLDADGIHLPTDQVPRWAARFRHADGTVRQVCFVSDRDVPPGARARPIHYIKISGVKAGPPEFGHTWPGEDLAAGIRLAALVAGRPYANQIAVADVRNYAGRMLKQGEPHLRYFAQVGRGNTTEIRFGRFPEPGGDHNVRTERKLSYIDAYVGRHNGRLAGLHSYIDLRFDELHVSVY